MPHLGDRNMDLIDFNSNRFDAGLRDGSSDWVESGLRTKKCGADHGDPNLRSQPRLPGSVVGESSMGQVEKGDKITEVTGRW